jgi:hypothetical protein
MRRPLVYSVFGAVFLTAHFADYTLGQTNLALQPIVPITRDEPSPSYATAGALQPTAAPIINIAQDHSVGTQRIPAPIINVGQESSVGMQRLPAPIINAGQENSGGGLIAPTMRDSRVSQDHAIELAPLQKPDRHAAFQNTNGGAPILETLSVVSMKKIIDEDKSRQQSTVRSVADMIGPPVEPSQLFVRSQTTREFLEGAEFFSQQRREFGPQGLSEWSPAGYAWQSPAFCYSPLYFEQINFERYGQGRSTPFAGASSAARFVGHTLILPISMIHNPPWCKECTLGHHRPGDCTPVQRMHKP